MIPGTGLSQFPWSDPLYEITLRILRSVLLSNDIEAKNVILEEGRTASERGSATVKLLTPGSVNVVGPNSLRMASSKVPKTVSVSEGLVLQKALADSVTVLSKLSKVKPGILANALNRQKNMQPVLTKFMRSKAGPPGWLGRLLQWGHVYQAQYFKWLYDHNQVSNFERYGLYTKKSGPDFGQRLKTSMKGPMWSYEYAEPGYNPEVAPYIEALKIDPNFSPSNWSQFKHALKAPESVIYDFILWSTGKRRSNVDWRIQYVERGKNFGVNPVADITAGLFDWNVVEKVFSRSKYLNGRDPRWATLLTAEEYNTFYYWCKIARWLVWAAETWRANDPKNGLVDTITVRKWLEHTHKWGVGFVFGSRLKNRRLFGSDLEGAEGERVTARMNAHSTMEFNTQKLLSLIMKHTPALMDMDNFRDDVIGSLCDWPVERTGSFSPTPRYPGVRAPVGFSAATGSGDWLNALNIKVRKEHAHSPQQKMVKNVARGIVSIMSSEIGGMASVYFEQLLSSAEGMVQDVLADVLDSQLWATVSTPVGRIADLWETEIQDKIGSVWGLYDALQQQIADPTQAARAVMTTNSIRAQLGTIEDNFPWTADLYGEVIPLAEESRKIERTLGKYM